MKTQRQIFSVKATGIGLFMIAMLLLSGCVRKETRVFDNTWSVIYDIDESQWTGGIDGYSHYMDVPEITGDIYYNGAVLVYRLVETAPKSFNMLPYTYTDNLLTINMDYDAFVGGINLMYKEVYNGMNDTQKPGNMSFKVVLIEGVPLASLKKMVDINNYEAVAKMLDVN